MRRRELLWGLVTLPFHKEFVRRDETVWLAKTLKTSDYTRVQIHNCEIRKLPWFSGETMIYADSDNYDISDNSIFFL